MESRADQTITVDKGNYWGKLYRKHRVKDVKPVIEHRKVSPLDPVRNADSKARHVTVELSSSQSFGR